MVDGKLLYKGRLVIPRSSKHIMVILTESHDSLAGGHSDVFKTLKRIQEGFHQTQMVKDVQDYVSACDVCQRQKYSTLSHA